jgi:hypothetical protein
LPESGTAPAIEDPKSTTAYRAARAAVIILGILLLIGFGLLIVGFAMKLRGHDLHADHTAPALFTLPPGAAIVHSEVNNNRLILHVRTKAGEEIDILDTTDGHLIGRVRTAAAP